MMTRKPAVFIVALAVVTVLGAALVEEVTAIVGMPFTPLSFAGVARRTTRRAVILGAGAASAAAATEAADAAAPAAATAPAAPPPVAKPTTQAPANPTGAPPIGTTVGSLPAGCTESTVNDIAYQNCGGVYYRPAFQGNNLVYVVVEKP